MELRFLNFYRNYLLLISSIFLGVVLSFFYWGVTPTRNSVLAIQTALNILNHPFDLEHFVNNTSLTFGKPLGLPIIYSLFHSVFKAPHSFYLASLVLGIIHQLVCFIYINTLRINSERNKSVILFCALFNPWSLQHFYSLGPDCPYMITIYLFLTFLHYIEKKENLLLSLGLAVVLCSAITMRLHALILLPIFLYFRIDSSFDFKSLSKSDGITLGVPLLYVLTGFLGKNPLLNLTSNADGGRDDYLHFILNSLSSFDYLLNVLQLLLFAVTTLGLLFIHLPSLHTNKIKKYLWVIIAIIISLIAYKWTYHNTRYYFILTPFIFFFIANYQKDFKSFVVWTTIFIVISSNTLINFANPLSNTIDKYYFFDNIRIQRRLKEQADLDLLKKIDCDNNRCTIVTVYHPHSYDHFYEKAGLLSERSNVYYADRLDQVNFKQDRTHYIWLKDYDEPYRYLDEAKIMLNKQKINYHIIGTSIFVINQDL